MGLRICDRDKGLTLERLKSILRYDPETGLFSWVSTGPGRKEKPGRINAYGYLQIGILGFRYYTHRLAWFYMTGEWPKEELDHINRNPLDNRFSNLREATHSQNQRNLSRPITNTSGYKGVVWLKTNKKWKAEMWHGGRNNHIGCYATKEEARDARQAAERAMFGEFCSGQ